MELTYTNVNGYLVTNHTYKSGEQMLAKSFHIPGGRFLAVTDSLLGVVDGILTVFVVEEFHCSFTSYVI